MSRGNAEPGRRRRGSKCLPQPVAETIETHGCPVVLRRVEGPEASELFFSCASLPPIGAADAGAQAEAIYRAILDVLEAEGASFASVVSETLFLRNLRAHLEPVRAARLGFSAARARRRRTDPPRPRSSNPR